MQRDRLVAKFERVENTMVMVRKEMKEMRDLLIEKVEKSMAGKVKKMEKNVVKQVKGMMMEYSREWRRK